MELKREKTISIIELLIIMISVVLLLNRAKYGYCFNDEPFCYTIAQRISYGDKLITDEWHVTQNIGPLLLPLYSIYHFFCSSNEGILLTFRYVYCAIWFLCCLLVYIVLRKRYKFAVVAFCYIIFFSPLDFMTLSYTSIGVMACMLICTLLFCFFEMHKFDSPIGIASLYSLLSCIMVLCCPYMAVAYIVLFVICIFYRVNAKTEESKFYLRHTQLVW